jgi:hypothetical protein
MEDLSEKDFRTEFLEKLSKFGLEDLGKTLNENIDYKMLNQEIDRIAESTANKTYGVIKWILIELLKLTLASFAFELPLDILEMRRKDKEFSKLWQFISFDLVLSTSKLFKKSSGDMLSSRCSQKGSLLLSKDEYRNRIRDLIPLCPQEIHYSIDLQSDSIGGLDRNYKFLFKYVANKQVYDSFSLLVKTTLMVGVAIMNSKMFPFSSEIRERLKHDSDLKFLWDTVPLKY